MAWDFAWSSTVRNVLLGASLLGGAGGVLGCFAVLRRQSLLGDSLAHAALPGVCLAFMLTGSKAPLVLFLGALAAGLAGALLVTAIVRGSKVKEDAAMGIVLSVFFGFGIVLLTRIQKSQDANQAGLDRYLWGQAATLLEDDIKVMAVVAAVVLAAVVLFYKELKLLSFDADFGRSLGLPMRRLEFALTALLAIVVVVGLQTVGVILMVATLIIPAAAARQWTERLGVMLLLAGAIGAASGATGAIASAASRGLSTGPTIVLAASAVLLASLLVAPARGILWSFLREARLARRVRRENLLKDIYLVAERTGDWNGAISRPAVEGLRARGGRTLARAARALGKRGLIERAGDGWRLLPAGLAEAERVVRNHRLWELYLTQRLDLPSDHVHRDAEAMEHALTDEAAAEIERALGHPTVDPHGRRIPPRRESRAGAVAP